MADDPASSRGRPGPKPRPEGPLKNRLAIRATDEWADWFAGFAAHLDCDKVALMDRALALLAAKHDYPLPPSRYPRDP